MLEDNSPPTQAEELPYPDVRRRTRPVATTSASAPNQRPLHHQPDSPAPQVGAAADTTTDVSLSPSGAPASAGYVVGYGKPPKHTRFQKGQSGNPKGRPKGAKSASTIVTDLLNKPMKAKIDGVTRNVIMLELALQQQVKKAITGDAKALQFLLSRIEPPAPSRSVNGGPSDENDANLTDTDRAILAHHQRNSLLEQGLDEAVITIVLRSMGLVEGEEEPS
jgi:hypothetical protein